MSTQQILADGKQFYVVKVDGTAAESGTVIADVSALSFGCSEVALRSVHYGIANGVVASFSWDASAAKPLIVLSGPNTGCLDYSKIGGIPNNAGAGKTGDVKMTVTGSGAYSITLTFTKKYQ